VGALVFWPAAVFYPGKNNQKSSSFHQEQGIRPDFSLTLWQCLDKNVLHGGVEAGCIAAVLLSH
jgi:hypothetical protein